ncbi:flagellin lysine-N-methylase [Oribacterium sp. KHPX15]|uniref:flagellin lysine-N-methylase n=1 Tax=Oribacterium sp. KHPX15 TaxID=1855342 RepID=UPI0011153AFB|nr:flagellin lysine-N-methylase [Oribacterium sp. KHPX15]
MSKDIIEPEYYKDFRCIGGDCSFTCCKEWKIAVDPDTKKKWKSIKTPEGMKEQGRLPESVSESDMLDAFIVKADDSEVIGLLPNMKCPFLEEDRLCILVKNHGEEVLSKTCHTFPRESHVYSDRVERALVSCCPEVVDRWKDIDSLSFTGFDYKDVSVIKNQKNVYRQVRDLMMYYLADDRVSNRINLLKAFFVLLDIYSKNGIRDPEEYFSESTLVELEETIETLFEEPEESVKERNELFLDITENYVKEGRYAEFLGPMIDEAERLKDCPDYAVFREKNKEYEKLMRNYLISETFSSLLFPEADIPDLVMQFEWIMMEYALMEHAIYLKWRSCPDKTVPYETVRDMMVLISRLTGYGMDDIEEYLVNSFEDAIWDFGYAVFLLG